MSLSRLGVQIAQLLVAVSALISVSVMCGRVVESAVPVADPPKVDAFFPAGGAVGETVTLQVLGALGGEPVTWVVDRPGIVLTAGEAANQVSLQIAADAAPGTYWVKATTASGASAWVPLLIDRLASHLETEPNDAPDQAALVALGAVLDGRLEKANDVDCYRVSLAQGEAVGFELLANETFGSPVDCVVQICDERGRVLEHVDDTVGMDPQGVFMAPRQGDYLIRVFGFPATPNSSIAFAGAADFIYRLRVHGTGEALNARQYWLDQTPRPLPVSASGLSFTTQPADGSLVAWRPDESAWQVWPRADGDVVEFDSMGPWRLSAGQVSWLEQPLDVEGWRLELEVADTSPLRVRVVSHGYARGFDPVALITDSEGKSLGEWDDNGQDRDIGVVWQPPGAGRYTLRVSDRFDRRLESAQAMIALERLDQTITGRWVSGEMSGAAGEALEVKLNLSAAAELKGAWRLVLLDAPGGVHAEPLEVTTIAAKPAEVTWQLQVGPEAESGPLQVGLVDEWGRVVSRVLVEIPRVGATHRWAWLTVQPSRNASEDAVPAAESN